MSREEKINKMIEEIKIRRNDEQYSGGPFPIYHIEFDILNEEIDRLNNIINELKLCNSDYKNQICTLSSKLERINEYISNSKRELSVDCYYEFKDLSEFDDIKEIIFDKTIKVGSDKE